MHENGLHLAQINTVDFFKVSFSPLKKYEKIFAAPFFFYNVLFHSPPPLSFAKV